MMFVGNELAGFGQRTGDGQFQFMVTALANLIKHSAALLTMIPIVDRLAAYKFSNAVLLVDDFDWWKTNLTEILAIDCLRGILVAGTCEGL